MSSVCHRCGKAAVYGKKYCAKHLQSRVASAETIHRSPKPDRPNLKHPLYGTVAWLRLKSAMLEDQPFCESCNRLGKLSLAKEVDHVIPIRVNMDLALDESNLQCLCKSCHQKKTQREKRGLFADFRSGTFIMESNVSS